MGWTGKVIGGLIGLVGGPIGVALGALLGHQYDVAEEESRRQQQSGAGLDPTLVGEHFFRSTFRVMGHIAKADGRVSEREIEAARGVMAELRLQPPQVQAAIRFFTAGKEAGFNLNEELASLARACAGRPDLVRIFLEIQVRAALAGNNLEGPARALVGRVAARLGISMIEFAQIEAVLRIRRGSFRHHVPVRDTAAQIEQAYKVLEVSPQASNDEVSRAYRRQLSRHHPDKLKANGLPESMIEHAKERTQQIIEAWELIKERRGIS
jgi:DnaJ like chaperone protein